MKVTTEREAGIESTPEVSAAALAAREYYAGRAEGTVLLPSELTAGRPNCFAAFLEGDCLAPTFQNGDMVLVDPDATPTPGAFVIIGRPGEQAAAARLIEAGTVPLLQHGSGAAYRAYGKVIVGVIVCAIRPAPAI